MISRDALSARPLPYSRHYCSSPLKTHPKLQNERDSERGRGENAVLDRVKGGKQVERERGKRNTLLKTEIRKK